jgi:hypothetical protein
LEVMKFYYSASIAAIVLLVALSIAKLVQDLFFPAAVVRKVEFVLPDPAIMQMSVASSVAVVRNGDQILPLANSLGALRQSTAQTGEAAHYNRGLNILVADLPASANAATEIGLDLREAGDAGFVIVSNGPVIWDIRGAPAGARAKLAFESETAISVKHAAPGLLAGFRVAAFGAPGVVTPADYLRRDEKWRFQNFCGSMQTWADYFGAPFDQVQVWVYEQSTQYHLRATEITADGRSQQWARSIAIDCAPPAPQPPEPPPLLVQRRTVYRR